MDKKLTSAVYAVVEKAYDHQCDIEDAADEILEIIEADRKRISDSLDKRIEDAMRLSLMNHDGYYDGLAYGYYIADRIVKGEIE